MKRTITMCSINVDDEICRKISILLFFFADERRPEDWELEKIVLWNHITHYLHVRNTRQCVELNCIDEKEYERDSIHLYERWVIEKHELVAHLIWWRPTNDMKKLASRFLFKENVVSSTLFSFRDILNHLRAIIAL